VGALIERYTELDPTIRIICYQSGYQGLLLGQSIEVTAEVRAKAALLHKLGGSPIGNSRVKMSNVEDCVKRGLVRAGQDPRQVAADQLVRDGVDVLHTIGGDDTNTAAADLAEYLHRSGIALSVVGLPKTIDNDIVPVRQSLGAWTAAEQAARFFQNVVAEQTANPRVLLVHEVMGRNCGYLTAAAARSYRTSLAAAEWLPEIGHTRERYDIHAVYVPEMELDLAAEAARLRKVMDAVGCANVFLSEGAGIGSIVAEMRARGEKVPMDPFGHVKIDQINPGQWFGKQFGAMVGAEKVLIQKSGYFCRSAAPNQEDQRLIKGCADFAVECAIKGVSGLIGHDEAHDGLLRAIEFSRVKGGKPFNIDLPWFTKLLEDIHQPKGKPITVESHGES
jgi:pyrophosphate--fructose-6-phosphate 1-phosphotransferase